MFFFARHGCRPPLVGDRLQIFRLIAVWSGEAPGGEGGILILVTGPSLQYLPTYLNSLPSITSEFLSWGQARCY